MTESTHHNTAILTKHKTARVSVSTIILLITYSGLVGIDIHGREFWFFSQMLAISVSGLSLWLYWYLFRHHDNSLRTSMLHHIMHWSATLIAIQSLSSLISCGIIAANQAGLFSFVLLAFSLFLFGVYTDTVFILLGISLAVLTYSIITFNNNTTLYNTAIMLASCFIIFTVAHYQHYTSQKKQHAEK